MNGKIISRKEWGGKTVACPQLTETKEEVTLSWLIDQENLPDGLLYYNEYKHHISEQDKNSDDWFSLDTNYGQR